MAIRQPHRKFIWALISVAVVVHLEGLFDPIFSGDSALYAGLAKQIVTSNDWLNLYVNGADWLDKPHFPFWVAAASMKLFGVSAFAYKLPSVLLFFGGVAYTYRLARDLYNPDVAILSTLVLLTAFHLFVSNNDVRAEAMLLCFVIGATYHFFRVAENGGWLHIVAGSAFAAAAVMTKGPFVVIIFVSAIGTHLLYKREYRKLLSWKWLAVATLTFIFILPELVALYVQFDLHPEKEVFGTTGVSGLKFFFWESQFGRFFNNGPITGGSRSTGYLDTLLWAFAPWAIAAYIAVGKQIVDVIKGRAAEVLILAGFGEMFVVFCISRFQLPYYTNILFPFLAILTANFIVTLRERSLWMRLGVYGSLGLQVFFGAAVVGSLEYAFGGYAIVSSVAIGAIATGFFFFLLRKETGIDLALPLSAAVGACLLAMYLNLVFYPRVLQYQAGQEAARFVTAQYPGRSLATASYDAVFDFNVTQNVVHLVSADDFDRLTPDHLVLVHKEFKDALDSAGAGYEVIAEFDDFRVTRLSLAFLDPSRRASVVDRRFLITPR